MPSTVALMSSIGVSMLASIARIHAARSQSRKSPGGGPPALLIRMSGSGTAASAAARPSGVVMSHATQRTGRPAFAPISSAVRCSTSASVRATIVTSQPASASACAQPRPSPLLAAQTSARLPAMPRSMASGDLAGERGAPRRRAAHADDGADRDQIARGDAEEHLARVPVIEHEAERDGADDAAQVEPGIDEAVDASRRALGRRGANDEVARGAGRTRARIRSARRPAAAAARERAPVATTTSTAAPSSIPPAATRSWRVVRAARKPPARIPAAPPSR